MTAKCQSCKKGVSVEEFCNDLSFPDLSSYYFDGCPKKEDCCEDKTAKCLSCLKKVSEEDYCKQSPKTEGCPKRFLS
jgi:hypothetical protein